MKQFLCIAMFSLYVGAVSGYAQQAAAAAGGSPVSMIVTHEWKGSATALSPQDVVVQEGKQQLAIGSLTSAEGTSMQLLLLIDDSARESFGTQVQSLKQFVAALPANVEVGIGYMRNGTNQMVSPFTRDHAAAASSVRLAVGVGGADVSPYDSLSEAIKNWPQASSASRREVIMISSGIEGLGGGFTPDNPYVNKGIEDAQKAGIVVYTIYNPSSGRSGRTFWRGMWGQNFLSQLADETGGEAYNINMGDPVSIDPFLSQIQQQMSHQYILTFAAKPENKAGLQRITVKLRERDGNVAAATKAYVKASL